MKMLKSEAVALYQNLNKLGQLKGVKFAYAVSKNLNMLKPEVESLEKASAFSDEYKKFDDLRVALAEKHSHKDEKGKPIMIPRADNPRLSDYSIENQALFDKEFEALKSEHLTVFDARQKQIEEYNELLQTESTVVLYKVSVADVPADITVTQMYSISAIVEDDIPSPFAGK